MRRLLFILAFFGAALGAEPPVKMAPYTVSEAMMKIPLVFGWQQNYAGQRLQSMRVGKIKPHSAAANAGLARGMEILAIQGQYVRGLTQSELAQILQIDVGHELVLTVERRPKEDPAEIHIPVGK